MRHLGSSWSNVALLALGLVIVACDGDGGGTDAGPRVDAFVPPVDGFRPIDAPVRTDTGSGLCGNGTIDTGEACDGTALGDVGCDERGFGGGTLACTATCTFDESGCTACGNGTIDAADGEDCDGAALGTATCTSQGFRSGELACAGDCTFDTSACANCGNGSLDGSEECDGSALGGATCATRGYDDGTLGCTTACGFDESGCTSAGCGNGTRAGDEECDTTDLAGATCNALGFFGGVVTCAADCRLDTDTCTNCGNGTVQGAEECDAAALAGQSCASLGFTAGTLTCASDCTFNTGACTLAACGNGIIDSTEGCDDRNATPGDGCTGCVVDAGFTCAGAPSSCTAICGNAQIHGTEECDGANFGGSTCVSLGYDTGALTCTSACRRDVSACASNCGNGMLDEDEECDDGNRVAFDGCDATCQVDANFDMPVRLRGGPAGNAGRVEIRFDGVWRDVCDDGLEFTGPSATQFANVVCRQLGFTGTGHRTMTFGGGTETPVMDNVTCTGTEPNLSQCAFNGWGSENCDPFEAVGVECVPAQGDVRLAGGGSGMDGRLQIFNAGAWGEVCDDLLENGIVTPGTRTRMTYDTACQQMGYTRGYFVSFYDAPADVFALDNLLCTGSERRVADCPHNAFGNEDCVRAEALGLFCDIAYEGDHRVVGGTARNAGRVEVLHDGVWGTVCDDGLFGANATSFVDVGCTALGYTGTGSLLLTIGVADGTDPILLDDVECVGTETLISSCPSLGFGVHNCSHSEDVGLSCTP